MPSIFSKIIAGEIPCYKIAENSDFIAFLDVFPLKKGHALVVPKKEVDYIFDLDDETYKGLMSFAKQVSVATKTSSTL
jgi:histidine triad (HIT) family protein